MKKNRLLENKNQGKGTTYKLRAECSQDVSSFIAKAHMQMQTFSMIKIDYLQDCEFVFESNLTLNEIVYVLKDLVDCHVMYQTVKPIDEFTGERNFEM